MTSAPRMPTARTFGMPIRTGVAAIVVTLFFNRLAGVHHAKTGFTGTFHLSNGRHGNLLIG
jgi:hypothetical protein